MFTRTCFNLDLMRNNVVSKYHIPPIYISIFCCILIFLLFIYLAPEVPEGYKIQFLPGFVEELVVNDDPEYKWIDKIRTPRASNEARQLLFMKVFSMYFV